MSEVVPITPKVKVEPPKAAEPEECVWTCGPCGCQSFQLLSSGHTLCCRCGFKSSCAGDSAEEQWRRLLPDVPPNLDMVPYVGLTNHIVDGGKPVSLALRSFSKSVTQEDPVALLMVRRDGAMRMWAETCDTEERRDWFRTRLDEAVEFILRLEKTQDG